MSSALSCPDCGTPHAVDQRYCVECGRRVRPLPATVANTLAVMAGERRIGAGGLNARGGASTPAESGGPGLTLFGSPLELPSPRAMAVGVLAVLAFGVIISSGNFSLASSPLVLKVPLPAAPAASAPLALAESGSSPSSSAAPAVGTGSASSTGGSSSTGGATATSTTATTATTPANSAGLPPIKHVWVIELGDQGYASTFDRGSPDTYLNTTLASRGQVVPQVYASATSDLANEVGLVSGQGPTVQTEADCPTYTALKPGTRAGRQVRGSGCVYPTSTPSMMSELTAAHDTWKAYVQGLGTTAATGCSHPRLGAKDRHFTARGANSYVTWRNPIVYLAGLTSLKRCGSDDTGLAALTTDLKTTAATPNVSFIFPNSCDDGSDTPCHPGAPVGTPQSDRFLKSIVPQIMASPAYRQDGMILITFAQSPQNVAAPDQSSCCDQPAKFPNLPSADYEPPTSATGTSTTATGTSTAGTSTAGTDTTGTSTAGTSTAGTDTATAETGTATGAESANDTGVGAGSDPTDASAVAPTVTTAPTAASPYTEATATAPVTTPTTPPATTPSTITGTGSTTPCVSGTTGTDTTTAATTAPTTASTATGTGTTGTDTTGTETTGTDTTGTDTTGTATSTTTAGSDCTPTPTSTSGTTGGGGQVGMLVLSRYVSKNLQDGEDMFNTFSITGSLEQLFGLKYTGYAATPGLPLFSGFFYSNYTSG